MPALILSSFVVVPLIGAAVVALLPPASGQGRRLVLLAVTFLELALGLLAVGNFLDLPEQFHSTVELFGSAGSQAVGVAGSVPWAPSLGLDLQLGIDHLNVFALVVIPLLFLIAMSANSVGGRGASMGLLVAMASLQGVFVAANLLLLTLFSQAAVFALFFALCMAKDDEAGGGVRSSERRRVALRFLLFNYAATLALLAAALSVRSTAQQKTGSPQLDPEQLLTLALPAEAQMWIAAAFGLYLVIQLPIAPFHGWLVDLLALRTKNPLVAVVVVGGWPLIATYVILRFAMPLCPEPVEQIGAHWGGALAAWVALYGGALALGQRSSLRRRLAYLCLGFNGVILLGLWTLTGEGIQGSFLYALSHGLVRALLVALALSVSLAAGGERIGRWQALLWWSAVVAFLGFPASAPFSGAILCMVAGFAAFPGHTVATLLGLSVAAYTLLSATTGADSTGAGGSRGALTGMAVAILGLVLFLGLHPAPLVQVTAPAVDHITGWLPTTGYSVIRVGNDESAPPLAPATTDSTQHPVNIEENP